VTVELVTLGGPGGERTIIRDNLFVTLEA
jgi:hypothetical protein